MDISEITCQQVLRSRPDPAEKVIKFPHAQHIQNQNKLANEAMDEIKREVASQDILSPTTTTWVLSILDSCGWFICVAWMFWHHVSAWSIGAVWGVAVARCGFVMHMAIHQAVFKCHKHNKWLAIFTKNILIGTSWRWWKNRHNKHHQGCNVVKSDPDLKTNPMLVYNEKLETGQLTMYQTMLLPAYLSVYMIVWRIASFSKSLKMGWKFDAVLTILHWVFLIFCFSESTYTVGELSLMLLLSNATAGFYLGIVFMMNHYLEEVLPQDHGMDLALHTLKTTRNIMSFNRFCDCTLVVLTGGLNLQIEHHLFSSCPINKLHNLAAIVHSSCTKRGLAYHTSSAAATVFELWNRLQKMEEVAAKRHTDANF